MTNTGYIKAAIRNAVSKRDRGVCAHCGKRASRAEVSKRGILCFFDEDGKVFHIDHKIPTSQGGASDEDNLVLACAPCNLSKRRAVVANDPEVRALIREFS